MPLKHALPVEFGLNSSSGPPSPFSSLWPSHLSHNAPAKLALL